jgi:hypothetical protein
MFSRDVCRTSCEKRSRDPRQLLIGRRGTHAPWFGGGKGGSQCVYVYMQVVGEGEKTLAYGGCAERTRGIRRDRIVDHVSPSHPTPPSRSLAIPLPLQYTECEDKGGKSERVRERERESKRGRARSLFE